MTRRTRMLLAGTALLVGTSTVHAQSAQRWSLQLSPIYVAAFGDAYEGLDNGLGFEGQVRLTPSAWSFGAGIQASVHGLSELDEDVTLAGIFFEPRYVIDIGKNQAPYISGRLSVLSQTATIQTTAGDIDLSATGAQFNVGGGVLFRLSPRINLDLGATLGIINFGDVEASRGGQTITIEGTSGNGQNLVLRVGLAIGLGANR
ncbi:MAG: outer membrane beta-barrel protein [Gemmatimonadota bacterium]